jgi:hypothetical protein
MDGRNHVRIFVAFAVLCNLPVVVSLQLVAPARPWHEVAPAFFMCIYAPILLAMPVVLKIWQIFSWKRFKRQCPVRDKKEFANVYKQFYADIIDEFLNKNIELKMNTQNIALVDESK